MMEKRTFTVVETQIKNGDNFATVGADYLELLAKTVKEYQNLTKHDRDRIESVIISRYTVYLEDDFDEEDTPDGWYRYMLNHEKTDSSFDFCGNVIAAVNGMEKAMENIRKEAQK